MRTFASKEKRPAPAARGRYHYVHHPMTHELKAQQAAMRKILWPDEVQAKPDTGENEGKYEQETDHAVADLPAPAISGMPAGGPGGAAPLQRSENEEPEEELQRQPEEEEEEPVQAKLIQRQPDNEDEEKPVQAKLIQRRMIAEMRGMQPSRFGYRSLDVKAQQARIGRILRSTGAQARLTIGQPNDKYEQEADRFADQVMTMPDADVAQRLETGRIQPMRIQRMCTECEEEQKLQRQPMEEEEEEEELQAKSKPGETPTVTPSLESRIINLKGGGQPLDPVTRNFFEPRFGHDFSRVRVHSDSAAADTAKSINARAFTLGNHVAMGSGEYQPNTPSGQRLLGHELTHIIQQNNVCVRRKPRQQITPLVSSRIQARRLPPQAEVTAVVSPGRASRGAHRTGLARLVTRAMAELNAVQQTVIRTNARGALSAAQFSGLPRWQRNQLLARAIFDLHPSLRHGDPSLFMTGPRPTTPDTANINLLASAANSHFASIALGARDASITQVFGAAHLATVKTRYANARTRMNTLHAANKILSDRSGYSGEVGLGGLTDSSKIMLSPSSIDNPGNDGSKITLIHEAMHAGNSSVDDLGYNDGSLIFTRMSASDKLNNAAHYEVVVWRVLDPGNALAYTGQTFTPAGIGASPPLTATQQGLQQTKDRFENAWSSCLDVHEMYMDLYRHPMKWTPRLSTFGYGGVPANARYRNTLPYWSKVAMLTIHQRRGTISPASANLSRRPVSRIDVALSEGVGRKLARAGGQMPQNQAAAQTFINSHTTAPQRATVAGNAGRIRNLLLRLVLRHRVGRITGSTNRDFKVVRRFAWADRWSRLLRPRNPNSFP